jgi:hypothetical protein
MHAEMHSARHFEMSTVCPLYIGMDVFACLSPSDLPSCELDSDDCASLLTQLAFSFFPFFAFCLPFFCLVSSFSALHCLVV